MTSTKAANDQRPLCNISEFTQDLRDKLREEKTIGVEIENLLFDRRTGKPPGYDQILQFFKHIQDDCAHNNINVGPQYEEHFEFDLDGNVIGQPQLNLIGLKFDNGMDISLEPSGAVEMASSVHHNLHDFERQLTQFYTLCQYAGDKTGLGMWNLGVQPSTPASEMPPIPKRRTEILYEKLIRTGGKAPEIAKIITGVQANLPFHPSPDDSDKDVDMKMKVAGKLQIVATALFANSPFAYGEYRGHESYRAHVWHDLAEKLPRCGIPDVIYTDNLTLDKWMEWAARDVKMYALLRDRELSNGVIIQDYLPTHGGRFDEFLAGDYKDGHVTCEALSETFNRAFVGQHATMADAYDFLHSVWTEARVVSFGGVEMRGSDSGSFDMVMAHSALWKGLLQDQEALEEAYELVTHPSFDKAYVESLRERVPVHGLQIDPTGEFLNLAKRVVSIAQDGLKRIGMGEETYLSPLNPVLETGMTQASHLIEKHKSEGQHGIRFLYDSPEAQIWEPGGSLIKTDHKRAMNGHDSDPHYGDRAGVSAGPQPLPAGAN